MIILFLLRKSGAVWNRERIWRCGYLPLLQNLSRKRACIVPVANMPQSKEYLRCLRERLSDEKVSHCVFTAEYLSSFAGSLGISHDEAVTAGLLHDFCRDLNKEEMLQQARAYRIPISESQMENRPCSMVRFCGNVSKGVRY